MNEAQKIEARKKADGIPVFFDTGDFLLNDFSAEELGTLIYAVYKYAKGGEKTDFEDRGMKLMYNLLCRDYDEYYGKRKPRYFEDLTWECGPKIHSTPQKEPLCLSCAHASMSVTDDFVDFLCAVSGGYEGGKTECEDYERGKERIERNRNGQSPAPCDGGTQASI